MSFMGLDSSREWPSIDRAPKGPVLKSGFARMSSALTALSPLDGRYAPKTRALQPHFSEFALMRHRVRVEIEWLKALAAEKAFTPLTAFSKATVVELDQVAAA